MIGVKGLSEVPPCLCSLVGGFELAVFVFQQRLARAIEWNGLDLVVFNRIDTAPP